MPLNTSNIVLNLSNWGKRLQRVLQKPSLARKPAPIVQRWNIVRGDIVEVTQGPQQGQRGKVKAVLRDTSRVIIEGVNLSKRYLRSRRPGKSGRTVIMPASVHYSNVHLIDPVSKYVLVVLLRLNYVIVILACYANFTANPQKFRENI